MLNVSAGGEAAAHRGCEQLEEDLMLPVIPVAVKENGWACSGGPASTEEEIWVEEKVLRDYREHPASAQALCQPPAQPPQHGKGWKEGSARRSHL